MPKVSIIVPVYKVEIYLDRCLSSILSQTFSDFEVVLVDDGSPDNCPQMCDSFAHMDSRVKVIHKQNEGLGMARNSGLDVAEGEYVIFVDSDDWMDINQCESLVNTIEKESADVVLCGHKLVNDEAVLSRFPIGFNCNLVDGRDLLKKYLTGAINMSVWHGIYRKDFLEQNKLRFISEREIISEDVTFSIPVACTARRVAFIRDDYHNYYVNGNSLSRTYSPTMYVDMIKLYNKVKNQIEGFNISLIKEELSCFFLQRCFDVLAIEYKHNPHSAGVVFTDISSDIFFRQNCTIGALLHMPFVKILPLFFLKYHHVGVALWFFRLRYSNKKGK